MIYFLSESQNSCFLSTGDNTTYGFSLCLYNGLLELTLSTSDSYWSPISTSVSSGIWSHIAFTWNSGNSSELALFINGSNVNSTTSYEVRTNISSTQGDIWIGQDGTGAYLEGIIDDFVFWNSLKDSDFIDDLYLAYQVGKFYKVKIHI